MMPNVIFIVGPTAVGKSAGAYFLAKKLGAQIISCDSMLVYKEPSIITSKPAPSMLKDVPHYFVGHVSVTESYSVFDYFREATRKILELKRRRVPVIVCGGSGLYVKAILDGIFEGVGKDEKLRASLDETAQKYGKQFLYEELSRRDPEAAKKIKPADTRRVIRALEVYYLTGYPISKKQQDARGIFGKIPVKIFGLRMERGLLYKCIDARVSYMFRTGAVNEVKNLIEFPLSITAQKIIGVKEIRAFLEGERGLEEAKEEMQRNTRHLAKRQFTWFNADKRIEWLDADGLNAQDIADKIFSKLSG